MTLTLISLMDTIAEALSASLSGVGTDGGEMALALAVASDLAVPDLKPRGTETGSALLGVRLGGSEPSFCFAVETSEVAEVLMLPKPPVQVQLIFG